MTFLDTSMYLDFQIAYAALMTGILFAGYVTASGYVTTIYGRYGFYSHMIVFICTVFGSLIAPLSVSRFLGIKWTMMIGAGTYIIYLAVYNLKIVPLFLVISAINGFGVGFFRPQQNTWITSMPIHSNKGYYLGLFNTIFGLYGIIGSSVAFTVFAFSLSNEILIWAMLGMAFSAFLGMICMADPRLHDKYDFRISTYGNFLKDGKLWLLIPMIFFQAHSMGFSYQLLPPYYDGDDFWIAISFLIYSTVFCVMSYIVGFLSRWIDIIVWLCILCMSSLSMAGYIVSIHIWIKMANQYQYLPLAITCGINDSVILFCIIYILSDRYKGNSMIYGYHRSVFSIFAAMLALIMSFVPWWIPCVIYIVSSICMCVGYIVYSRMDNADEQIPLLTV